MVAIHQDKSSIRRSRNISLASYSSVEALEAIVPEARRCRNKFARFLLRILSLSLATPGAVRCCKNGFGVNGLLVVKVRF